MKKHNKKKRLSVGLQLLLFAFFAGSFQVVAQEVRDVAFVSNHDATQQHYVEIIPNAFNGNDSVSIIIGLHGHGSDRWQFATDNRPECLAFRQFASAHQMIAVTPDYRAKTSWMGLDAEKDLLQIIEELKSKYLVRRVYLVGGSMGGTSALTFSALHPHLIDGVTAMNAHANHLEYTGFQDAIADSFGGSKEEIPAEYKKRSAEYWPEKLTMPISFTVGVTDTIVPPTSIYRLVNLLGKLNKQVLLITDGIAGHNTNFDVAYAAMQFMIKENRK